MGMFVYQRVSNAALANAALVLSSKNWKKYSGWGGCVEKYIQNALGFLPACGNRCRFSESAICSSRVRPPSKIRSNLKFKTLIGDRKSLSIAKNHPKTSQEFSEQFGPSTHKIKGFSKNSHRKVHPNFAENLGRQILGNTISGPKLRWRLLRWRLTLSKCKSLMKDTDFQLERVNSVTSSVTTAGSFRAAPYITKLTQFVLELRSAWPMKNSRKKGAGWAPGKVPEKRKTAGKTP